MATLDQDALNGLVAAVEVLEQAGPTLGRPLVDTVTGSKHQNMKELRTPSAGRTEIGMLFAFDPMRKAIMLLGGDKSGTAAPKASKKDKWANWYKKAIPTADRIFDEHLAALEGGKAGSNGSGEHAKH